MCNMCHDKVKVAMNLRRNAYAHMEMTCACYDQAAIGRLSLCNISIADGPHFAVLLSRALALAELTLG